LSVFSRQLSEMAAGGSKLTPCTEIIPSGDDFNQRSSTRTRT
jgi:hypothetical protein